MATALERILETEGGAFADRMLDSLPRVAREALIRYYSGEATVMEICASQAITVDQFLAWKGQAREAYLRFVTDRITEIELELYDMVRRIGRSRLAGRLMPEDAEDCIHAAYVGALLAVRSGALRDPGCLPGYIVTIVRRQACAFRGRMMMQNGMAARCRSTAPSPEESVIAANKRQVASRMFASLSDLDRAILNKHYVRGESPTEICQALGITYNQFRNGKTRGKERYARLVSAAMQAR